jgi:hypothetical protein
MSSCATSGAKVASEDLSLKRKLVVPRPSFDHGVVLVDEDLPRLTDSGGRLPQLARRPNCTKGFQAENVKPV